MPSYTAISLDQNFPFSKSSQGITFQNTISTIEITVSLYVKQYKKF